MFFNDVLQNTKLHANNVNCQTLVGVMMDLVMEKKVFMEIVEGAIVEVGSGGVQC